eukprot:scaffold57247_cov37-Cyclotella_meneghiniana.AAC.3
MEHDMMSTLTMEWCTPLKKPNTEEQRHQIGRVKSYNSLQSMDYFTARSQHTCDMDTGKSFASSIDTNELDDQAINAPLSLFDELSFDLLLEDVLSLPYGRFL